MPSTSSLVTSILIEVHPETLRPFGHLEQRKRASLKRKKTKSEICTDTLVKKRIEEERKGKGKGKRAVARKVIQNKRKTKIPER